MLSMPFRLTIGMLSFLVLVVNILVSSHMRTTIHFVLLAYIYILILHGFLAKPPSCLDATSNMVYENESRNAPLHWSAKNHFRILGSFRKGSSCAVGGIPKKGIFDCSFARWSQWPSISNEEGSSSYFNAKQCSDLTNKI